MAAARNRYEVRVGTHLSTAAISTFRVPVTPTAVPRETVYRFRVPADRDLTEVLDRLIGRDVQVLEIRQCPEPPVRGRGPEPGRPAEAPAEVPAGTGPADGDGVVVPFRAASATGRRGEDPPRRRRRRAGPAEGPSAG
ncbi:hypothetical protein [Geodermatophilus sp. SYSU D00766]